MTFAFETALPFRYEIGVREKMVCVKSLAFIRELAQIPEALVAVFQ